MPQAQPLDDKVERPRARDTQLLPDWENGRMTARKRTRARGSRRRVPMGTSSDMSSHGQGG